LFLNEAKIMENKEENKG